jgi:hypothetical protein
MTVLCLFICRACYSFLACHLIRALLQLLVEFILEWSCEDIGNDVLTSPHTSVAFWEPLITVWLVIYPLQKTVLRSVGTVLQNTFYRKMYFVTNVVASISGSGRIVLITWMLSNEYTKYNYAKIYYIQGLLTVQNSKWIRVHHWTVLTMLWTEFIVDTVR